MKNNGKKTKRGYLSKERIKLGNGVQIPKLLPYNSLIKKIHELDIGEVYNLSGTICSDLPENEKVNGVYRHLEQLLLALSSIWKLIVLEKISLLGLVQRKQAWK